MNAIFIALSFLTAIAGLSLAGPIVIEAEAFTRQAGSTGEDAKSAASGGKVLGKDFGSGPGNFAEYEFTAAEAIEPAYVRITYARALAGSAHLAVSLDGAVIGTAACPTTGGWGDDAKQFHAAHLRAGAIAMGKHTLRVAVAEMNATQFKLPALTPSRVLDLVGGRDDKNSVGHGRNVAIYTGTPSRFFYATHELGDVFDIVDGGTIAWYPDQVMTTPQRVQGNINIDRIEIDGANDQAARTGAAGPGGDGPQPEKPVVQFQQVCVTEDDVVVARVHVLNTSDRAVNHEVVVRGDCRNSFDWRNKPGGEKPTREDGLAVVMVDRNVFPEILRDGLAIAVGAATPPIKARTDPAGTYALTYSMKLAAGEEKVLTLGCAIDPDPATAKRRLAAVLATPDPVAQNRASWERFYENDVPRFECSDKKLNELYAFRWFLLKFSTAGGGLGLYKYPVVMEGRQAFQTYCCYSAPFMAMDMNWAVDPMVGFGHIANMVNVAYEDGRFPWYASPRTNQVPLDHASKTGMSLLQHTAWRWYEIHRRDDLLKQIYPGLKKNMQWWIADRDADGNGLFDIDHQLETGMDDLHRRWPGGAHPPRYEAIDATAYAVLNLRAVANMAGALGERDDANYFAAYADRSEKALDSTAWDDTTKCWRDRNPQSGELSDYTSITIFYPLLTSGVDPGHAQAVIGRLLDPKQFWLPHPVPALSAGDPEFDPVRRYWAGPSWPAATSHVIEGFATTAKRSDRSRLPEAAELFHRAVANHVQPRADFFERYDPNTGKPLSTFRDYMHSWWIDLVIRHAVGLTFEADGSLSIDPLPMNLTWFRLENVPYRGKRLDISWRADPPGKGLIVDMKGKTLYANPRFEPGNENALVNMELKK